MMVMAMMATLILRVMVNMIVMVTVILMLSMMKVTELKNNIEDKYQKHMATASRDMLMTKSGNMSALAMSAEFGAISPFGLV